MYVEACSAIKPVLYEAACYAITDRYTEGGPDDDRVARRYLDWLIFCKERSAGYERGDGRERVRPTGSRRTQAAGQRLGTIDPGTPS
jgi:hypothetical protein